MGPVSGQPPSAAVGQPKAAPVWAALLILGIAVGVFVATLRPLPEPEKLRGPRRGA